MQQISSDSDGKWLRYEQSNMANPHTRIFGVSKSRLWYVYTFVCISETIPNTIMIFLLGVVLIHIFKCSKFKKIGYSRRKSKLVPNLSNNDKLTKSAATLGLQ